MLPANANLIYDASTVQAAVERVALDVSQALSDRHPVVITLLTGGVIFAGWLLPKLHFLLDMDFVQVGRYGMQQTGATLHWRLLPQRVLAQRTVLLVDDILDEGISLKAVRDKCLQLGAMAVYSAVLCEKQHRRDKVIRADFVGLQVPDEFVFGCGMDVRGGLRHLAEIYTCGEKF